MQVDSPKYDVIVVGAGLAGLSAARELLKREPALKILVLEAKNRVGGRTLTVPMKAAGGKTHVDVGASWVSRDQKHMLELVNDFHLKTSSQYCDGVAWCQFGVSKPKRYGSSKLIRQVPLKDAFDVWWNMRKMDKLAQKVNLSDLFSWDLAAKLDETSVAQWIRQNAWGRSAQDILEITIRALYGVEPNRVNMLYHLAVCKSAGSLTKLLSGDDDGALALRVEGGTNQIASRLAEEIGSSRIRLKQAVHRIEVDEANGLTRLHYTSPETSQKSVLACSQVILAIPPNQCARIDFWPILPYLKRRAFEAGVTGNTIKFVITYETAFWREEGWSGEIISSGRTTKRGEVLPVICAYDYCSNTRTPAIVGMISEEYADLAKSDRCNVVVQDLMRFFGDHAMLKFIDYQEKDWSLDLFGGGGSSVVMPCGTMYSWQFLKDPFLTIHFAGSETANHWIGYMEGAIESGLRSAHEVLQQLGYYDSVSYTILKGTVYDNDYRPPQAYTTYYREKKRPWLRRLFFFSALCLGIFALSKKYRLSYTARVIRPLEKYMVRYTTGLNWP
ncbi:unnamed protein product [Cylicocyclus nassatus]|uniref:Amine oxidase n=1 Tax=Cylicocyclus nassatus TaxID=53992 RepID=A0AA36DL50_CYLNA|nr:unnamed protein product [Cylicocyclus nassatus]